MNVKGRFARKDEGFTLIEIIAVLVILGILAAVAVPKYIDMQDGARRSAVQAMAGNIASASALNFAARTSDSTKGQAVTNCSNGSALVDGFDTTKYSITAGAVGAGATAQCTITDAVKTSITSTFTIHGIN